MLFKIRYRGSEHNLKIYEVQMWSENATKDGEDVLIKTRKVSETELADYLKDEL